MALLCLTMSVSAQDKKDYSAYLQGAVPQVDGKVVFEKKLSTHALPIDALWKTLTTWTEERMAKNKNNSRVAYADVDKRIIAAVAEEYLVFQSNALSLDRALTKYLMTISVQPDDCRMVIRRIGYNYEDEFMTAEQQITDSAALYKDGTKIRRRLRKFRVHTVDLVNSLYAEAEVAINKTAVAMLDQRPVQAAASTQLVVATQQPVSSTTKVTSVNNVPAKPHTIGTPKTGVPVQVVQTTVAPVASKVVPMGYSLMVKDMAKSVEFYMTHFGLKQQSSFASPDGQYKMTQLVFPNSTFTLQLIQQKGVSVQVSNGMALVFKAGSYKRLSTSLMEKGLIEGPVDEASFTVQDPNGYKVQVMK